MSGRLSRSGVRPSVRAPILALVVLSTLVTCRPAPAQSYAGDARKIGMGGVGYQENIATAMIDEERPYRAVVIPLGLIQLFRNRRHFDPDDPQFDPVLAMEYAANPLHYVLGLEAKGARGKFVRDAVNGTFSRDLTSYRGFVPANKLTAEGLASPSWGKTFKFLRRDDGTFHGFYVGAGPYISAKTVLNIDPGLTEALNAGSTASLANRTFSIADGSAGQLALAVTGGYRGRIPWPGRTGGRQGIYVGANYHYLYGFRYSAADLQVRFDTDSAGLITPRPAAVPAVVDYFSARSGRGLALDAAVAAVIDRWEFGIGANGIANRIDWDGLTGKRYRLESLIAGGDFAKQPLAVASPELRVKLPVQYTENAGYHAENWSVMTEVSQGFQKWTFHGGGEWRLGRIDLRGGGRYSLQRWHPAAGIGLNLGHRFSLDLAMFGSTTNIERQMRPALALSLRFNRTPQDD